MIDNDGHPNWPHWLNWLLALMALVAVIGSRLKTICGWFADFWNWIAKRFNAMSDLAEAITRLSESFEALVKVTESRFSVVESRLDENRRHTTIAHAQTALILDEDSTPRFRCKLPEGSCDWVNPALAHLFNRDVHSCLVWEWLSAIHPDDITRVQSEWLACIRTGTPYRTRYRVLTGRDPVSVEATGHVIKDDTGLGIAVLGKVVPVPIHT